MEATGGGQGRSLRTDISNWKKSLWKTPVASDAANREFYVNSRGEPNLSAQVKLWPTPRAQEYKDSLQSLPPCRIKDPGKDNLTQRMARSMLPTPESGDYRSPNKNPGVRGKSGILPQSEHSLPTMIGGQLNPTWVEWLMGFPLGWTDLNASEMP